MPRNHPEYERGYTERFDAGTRFQAERTPPSDAEQLSELRRVAQTCLTWFEWWVEAKQSDPPMQSVEVLRHLRAVLNPRQPEKETQGT